MTKEQMNHKYNAKCGDQISIKEKQARHPSPLSHIRLLSDFFIYVLATCGQGRAGVWHLFISKRQSACGAPPPRQPPFQTTQGDSWCAASPLFEGFDLRLPRPVAGVSAGSPRRPRLTSPLWLLAISPDKMADSKSPVGRALAGAS